MKAPPSGRRRNLIMAALGVASFLLAWVFARVPRVIELLYARFISPALIWTLSKITGVLPLSLADLLILGVSGFELATLVLLLARSFRRARRRDVLIEFVARRGRDAGVIVTAFYLLWGFNYSRPPLERRLGWNDVTPAQLNELVHLAMEAVDGANQAYFELHNTTDLGHPTEMTDLRAIEASLDRSWKETAFLLGLPASAGWEYGRVKRPFVSPVMDRLGLSGFFFPWTGEANVNRGIPAVSVPFVMAHEKAHQRGTGPENEANFLGFVVALNADNLFARYAAYIFAQSQLTFAVARLDPARYRQLAALRMPGVQRDLDAQREYWLKFKGPVARMSDRLNDTYLKLNLVKEGIASYGRSTALIISFARLNGGSLTP